MGKKFEEFVLSELEAARLQAARLEAECERLTEQLNEMREEAEDPLMDEIVDLGRDALYERMSQYWRKAEAGESFDAWADRAFDWNRLPHDVARADFEEAFDDRMHCEYELQSERAASRAASAGEDGKAA